MEPTVALMHLSSEPSAPLPLATWLRVEHSESTTALLAGTAAAFAGTAVSVEAARASAVAAIANFFTMSSVNEIGGSSGENHFGELRGWQSYLSTSTLTED